MSARMSTRRSASSPRLEDTSTPLTDKVRPQLGIPRPVTDSPIATPRRLLQKRLQLARRDLLKLLLVLASDVSSLVKRQVREDDERPDGRRVGGGTVLDELELAARLGGEDGRDEGDDFGRKGRDGRRGRGERGGRGREGRERGVVQLEDGFEVGADFPAGRARFLAQQHASQSYVTHLLVADWFNNFPMPSTCPWRNALPLDNPVGWLARFRNSTGEAAPNVASKRIASWKSRIVVSGRR